MATTTKQSKQSKKGTKPVNGKGSAGDKPVNGKGSAGDKPASKPAGKGKAKLFLLHDGETKVQPGAVQKWSVNGIPIETKVSAGVQTKRDGSGKEASIRYASVKIFGFNLSSVLRTLGREEVSTAAARSIMENLKLTSVRYSQIVDKIGDGRNGVESNYAELTKKQIEQLCELIDE